MRIYQYITYIISLALVFLSPSHGLQSIFPKIQSKIPNLMQTGAEILTSLNSDTSTFKLPLGPPAKTSSKYLYFTGAGIYFWWQAGTAKYIQRNYDLRNVRLVGASAGSLTSLLLVCGCDFDKAALTALRIATKANIFERKGGMVGILGSMIREWLEEVVPDDITPEQLSQLYISLTPIGKKSYLVSDFTGKDDVINACLASCHVPIFLDGRVVTEYKGDQVLDGSFWYFIKKDRYLGLPLLPDSSSQDIVWVDYGDDEEFMQSISGNFLETTTPDGLYDMMASGYRYMERIHEQTKVSLSPTSSAFVSQTKTAISSYVGQFMNNVKVFG